MAELTFKENEKNILKQVNDEFGDTGWDFKQYILGFLFYRFLSEKITLQINTNQKKANAENQDYAVLDDEIAGRGRDSNIEEFGFHIQPSELFENIVKTASDDSNLNETLSRIFSNIESSAIGSQSESSFKGLFRELNLNSEYLGDTVEKRNKKLSGYLQMVRSWSLELLSSENNFGNLFESLIGNFAAKAGKKGGNFFTPKSVSELIVNLAISKNPSIKRVYDPACGSGSLLLKFSNNLDNINNKIEYYGQDEDLTFYNFCRINMLLHNISFDENDIKLGDTLSDPKHLDSEKFDAVVSNPRFSKGWGGKSNPLFINDVRFSPAGVLAPEKKHDMAFIMHSLYSLNENGLAVMAQHPGVMYRDKTERKIRKYLIDNNFVDCVIQLPTNLFFGVPGFAPNILILKKAKQSQDIYFINAEREFVRGGNRNLLSPENIAKIVNLYKDRINVDSISRAVELEEVASKNYLLSVSGYIESENIAEKVDIKILNSTIKEIVKKQNSLRNSIDVIIEEVERASK